MHVINTDNVYEYVGNSATAQGKSYPLCPCCYNHPPTFIEGPVENEDEKDDSVRPESHLDQMVASSSKGVTVSPIVVHDNEIAMTKLLRMGCNECLHPTCKHGVIVNGICECPNTIVTTNDKSIKCNGTLVLDVNSKPNWKLACNQCNVILRFHANIHDVIPISRKHCEECDTKICKFEFNKLKTPLPNNETTYVGCIICDDMLNSLTEIISGRSIHLTLLRQQRHKRNARGGRGGRGGRFRNNAKGGNVKMSFSDF